VRKILDINFVGGSILDAATVVNEYLALRCMTGNTRGDDVTRPEAVRDHNIHSTIARSQFLDLAAIKRKNDFFPASSSLDAG